MCEIAIGGGMERICEVERENITHNKLIRGHWRFWFSRVQARQLEERESNEVEGNEGKNIN